jgi:hypothetical protein
MVELPPGGYTAHSRGRVQPHGRAPGDELPDRVVVQALTTGRRQAVENGGQMIVGATVTSATISSVTNASGRYSLSFPAAVGVSPSAINGAGLIPRNGFFGNSGSRTVISTRSR